MKAGTLRSDPRRLCVRRLPPKLVLICSKFKGWSPDSTEKPCHAAVTHKYQIFRSPLTSLPVDDDQKHPQRSDQKDEGGEHVPSRTHPSSLGDVVLLLAPSLFTVGQPQHRWQTDHIIWSLVRSKSDHIRPQVGKVTCNMVGGHKVVRTGRAHKSNWRTRAQEAQDRPTVRTPGRNISNAGRRNWQPTISMKPFF